MTAPSARALRTSAAALLVLLAAGCGSSAATTTATGSGSGDTAAPAGTYASTPAATTAATPEATITPSSDVGGATDLAAWLTQVCTASNDTLQASKPKIDPSAIAKDPQKAAQDLMATYRDFGSSLSAFADKLEQIGAPDIPDGKAITDHVVDDAHALGDALNELTEGLPQDATLQQVLAQLQSSFKSGKAKAAVADLEKIGKRLDTAQIDAVAKTIPECKKADIG
jgi:hypothetical protein